MAESSLQRPDQREVREGWIPSLALGLNLYSLDFDINLRSRDSYVAVLVQ